VRDRDFIDRQLRRYALERYRRFGSMPLPQFNSSAAIFRTLPNSFLEFLTQYRAPVLDWLNSSIPRSEHSGAGNDALPFLVDSMTYCIEKKNQFIVMGGDERDGLVAVYERFLGDFRDALLLSPRKDALTAKLEEVLASHQVDLIELGNDLVAANVGPDFVTGEAICSEYSPTLQLDVLKTRPDEMLDPILDLGCGERGSLVHYLRDRGKLAYGVDRLVRADRHLIRGDWLDYPLGRGYWGTVISHMGFSNHFLHHHLRRSGHPERYAWRYMEVLRALRPGGSFIYAPGMPFMEDLLPGDEYGVSRFPLSALSGTAVDVSLQARLRGTVLYACRVTQLPKP
jgi:hypothetical protein